MHSFRGQPHLPRRPRLLRSHLCPKSFANPLADLKPISIAEPGPDPASLVVPDAVADCKSEPRADLSTDTGPDAVANRAPHGESNAAANSGPDTGAYERADHFRPDSVAF